MPLAARREVACHRGSDDYEVAAGDCISRVHLEEGQHYRHHDAATTDAGDDRESDQDRQNCSASDLPVCDREDLLLDALLIEATQELGAAALVVGRAGGVPEFSDDCVDVGFLNIIGTDITNKNMTQEYDD